MKQPAAFRGTYSDWRLVKTRAVVQIIFEVPLANADAAYEVLGGMPVHGKERWFGIAAIKSTAEEAAQPRQDSPPSSHPGGAKREWRDIPPAQQAGIRCEEPIFAAFLKETRKDDWHETQDATDCVRLICGVESRAYLSTNQRARVIWHQLDTEYQAWLAKERVGA